MENLQYKEIIQKYLDKSNLIDFKSNLYKLTIKEVEHLKKINNNKLNDWELALNSINNIGKSFNKIILFNYKQLSLIEFKEFIKGFFI